LVYTQYFIYSIDVNGEFRMMLRGCRKAKQNK
jgi:hypothetical protein